MQADQINENEMKLEFDARSVNEGFARMAVAAFVAELNPTLDEISDIKTAVSEAVTNAITTGMTVRRRRWRCPVNCAETMQRSQ